MSPPPPRAPSRLVGAWARSVGFTVALTLLVAWGIGHDARALSAAVLVAAALGLGLLYLLFPRGLHFAFGTATGFAVYASLFTVLGQAQFPDASDLARPVAFLLPVLAFLGQVWRRRAELVAVAERQTARSLDHLPRAMRWLASVSLVGLACFMMPLNRLEGEWQAAALLAAMGGIALLVAIAVREVVQLLVDVALIVDELVGRARHVAAPITAFLLIYALLVILFAAVYRIADGLSREPLFHAPDGPIRLTYSDALHFSVATLSTVGYGDIRPSDDGARVLASLQVVAGQILLLFGVAELLRGRQAPRPRLDHHGPDGHASPRREDAGDGHGGAH